MGLKGNKAKFSGWGRFLKSRRETRYRSARELTTQVALGISYPQYSRYEAGEQLPGLDQALILGSILGVAPLEMVLEWSKAQIPAREASALGGVEALLNEVREPGHTNESEAHNHSAQSVVSGSWPARPSERTVPLDDVIVFNRAHLRVFSSDPAYRDIFTYINSFGPEPISVVEIAEALGLDPLRCREMLEKLSELGVIVIDALGGCRASKRNFYFPDDEDFFELRNLNLRHNADSILGRLNHADLTARKAYRGLVTRELTQEQVGLLLTGVDQLMGQLVAMPETSQPRTIYSLCVLFGDRFERADALRSAIE